MYVVESYTYDIYLFGHVGVDGVAAPPLMAFDYNVVPQEGSREEYLIDVLRAPREWATPKE
jgi:coproporphyrinogen III oxidase